MSYQDALNFCAELKEQEPKGGQNKAGMLYTLPTEAQWEYACRGGSTTCFVFGDDESRLSDYASYDKFREGHEKEAHHSRNVGQKKANPWGLCDMHGNVLEWCRDRYQERLEGGRDPYVGIGSRSEVILRGGSWMSTPRWLRSASRYKFEPTFRGSNVGFRLLIAD